MEKWRLYMILAGLLLVFINASNIDFNNLQASLTPVIGALSSLVFVVILIITRKK